MKIETRRISSRCETCQGKFDQDLLLFEGREVLKMRDCPACSAARNARILEAENKMRAQIFTERWRRFCPARYRDSQIDRLRLYSHQVERVMRWRPSKEGRGLGVVGPPRIGKRHLVFLLARDLFFSGVRIAQTSAIDFDQLASDRFDDALRNLARSKMEMIRSAPVLILSDIGTEKLTERGQVEFYSLIEHRAGHLLPILWTTQFSGAELEAKFFTSRAENVAIARARGRSAIGRLNQCSDVVRVERETFVSDSVPIPQARSA